MRSTLEQENPRLLLDVQVCSDLESRGAAALLNSSYPGGGGSASPTEAEAFLCVYSSRASLEVVRKSLEQSLLTDLAFGHGHHVAHALGASQGVGLPLVLLLAASADQGSSAKERAYLREEGQSRAASLQCAFFDVTSDEPHARFKSDELLRALLFLSEAVVRRADLLLHSSVTSSSVGNYSPTSSSSAQQQQLIPEGALNPEIRILLVLMCGDPVLPGELLELLLLPLTPPDRARLYPVSKNSVVADVGALLAIDEDSLDDQHQLLPLEARENESAPSRYVEFQLTSYHSAHQLFREEMEEQMGEDGRLVHGYIMVYWSKRQASFANMSALASTVVPLMMTPVQLLALVENESRPSKLSHQLVADGQAIAQSLNVSRSSGFCLFLLLWKTVIRIFRSELIVGLRVVKKIGKVSVVFQVVSVIISSLGQLNLQLGRPEGDRLRPKALTELPLLRRRPRHLLLVQLQLLGKGLPRALHRLADLVGTGGRGALQQLKVRGEGGGGVGRLRLQVLNADGQLAPLPLHLQQLLLQAEEFA